MLIWRKCPRAWGTLGATGGEVGGRGRGGVAGGGVGTLTEAQPEHRQTPKTYCELRVSPLQRAWTHFWQPLH